MEYDFIEIGTSDFRTIVEQVDNNTVGICVEPIASYLKNLPTKAKVKKVQAAISDFDGEIDIYYVPLDVIRKYNLPNWVRGCNSVGKPHPTVLKLLGQASYDKVAVKETVPVYSFSTFVELYNIDSIGTLQIDTEGHDGVIMLDYLKLCEAVPSLYASTIKFENNILADKDKVSEILERVKGLYKVEHLPDDVVLTKI